MAKITRTNPEGISKPFSNYSHVVTAEGAQKLVLRIGLVIPYFSGIIALLATGLLPNALSMMSAARSSVPLTKCP